MDLAKIILLNSNSTASMKCLPANTIYYVTLHFKFEHETRACDKNHILSDQLNDIVCQAKSFNLRWAERNAIFT